MTSDRQRVNDKFSKSTPKLHPVPVEPEVWKQVSILSSPSCRSEQSSVMITTLISLESPEKLNAFGVGMQSVMTHN